MKYERITKRIGGVTAIKTHTGSWCTPFDSDEIRAIDRLCALEDKIEQGKLKEIPENAVVVSRAEYNDLKGLEKHFDDYLIKEIVATRKETAKEIANWLPTTVNKDKNILSTIIKEHYGVEVE